MRARAALLALSLGAAGVGLGCRPRSASPAGPAPAGSSTATARVAVTSPATAPGGARLAAGDVGTCAITADGRLFCWGDHEAGDTAGLPGPTHRLPREIPAVPEPIAGIPGRVVAVAVGDSAGSCAVTDAGALHCWGDAGALLGLGPRQQRPEPAPAVGITGEVVAVSVGFESVLALTADGTVWGAGLLGPRGQRDRNPPNPAAGFVRLGGGYAGVHAEGFDDDASASRTGAGSGCSARGSRRTLSPAPIFARSPASAPGASSGSPCSPRSRRSASSRPRSS